MLNILVVDDEPTLRSFAEIVLADLGYTAVLAESGRAAVQALLQDPDSIAAVLLDLSMPGMPPEQTLRAIREIAPKLPIVILSGELESSARQTLGEATFDGYIQKPYTDEEIQLVLTPLLTQSGLEDSEPFQLRPLSPQDLSTARHEYLAISRHHLIQIQALLKQLDFAALQASGHRLKGSGGCFGMPELSQIGAELEISAVASDPHSCELLLGRLKSCLDKSES